MMKYLLTILLVLMMTTQGWCGASRDFESGSSHEIRSQTNIPSATPITMACWAWHESDQGTNNRIFGLWRTADGERIIVSIVDNASNQILRMNCNDGTNVLNDIASGPSNQTWFHTAMTDQGTTRSLFLDGGDKTTNNTSLSYSAMDTIVFGANGDLVGGNWDGKIAHAAVWTGILTDDEIASLASGVSPTMIRPDILHAYYPCTEEGGIIIDLQGNSPADSGTAPLSSTDGPPIFFPRGGM